MLVPSVIGSNYACVLFALNCHRQQACNCHRQQACNCHRQHHACFNCHRRQYCLQSCWLFKCHRQQSCLPRDFATSSAAISTNKSRLSKVSIFRRQSEGCGPHGSRRGAAYGGSRARGSLGGRGCFAVPFAVRCGLAGDDTDGRLGFFRPHFIHNTCHASSIAA